jgi:hypothetical protein
MDFALQPEYRAQRRRRRLSKAQEGLELSMSRLSMEAPTYFSGRQHCRRKPRFPIILQRAGGLGQWAPFI